MKLYRHISLAAIILAAMTANNAHAGLVSIVGSWSGAPYSNAVTVTLAADIDLSSPAFDLGAAAGKAHQWWWSTGPATFTNVVDRKSVV